MFEKLELSVRAFCQYWCAERFHDFLDRNRLTRQLVFGGTAQFSTKHQHETGPYHTSPKAPIPTG